MSQSFSQYINQAYDVIIFTFQQIYFPFCNEIMEVLIQEITSKFVMIGYCLLLLTL